jgi:hypothetical protein
MSFRGAVLILSSAMGRHLVQGNLVSKSNLVSWFLRVWFIFSTFPRKVDAREHGIPIWPLEPSQSLKDIGGEMTSIVWVSIFYNPKPWDYVL